MRSRTTDLLIISALTCEEGHHPASGTLRQPRDTELRLLLERLDAGLPRHLKHALLYGSATTALLPQRHIHAGSCKLLHVDSATAGG